MSDCLAIRGFLKLSMVDVYDKMAMTIFLGGCNFKCKYCHNIPLAKNELDTSYSEDEIIKTIHDRKGIIDAICISGGEPLLPSNFENLKNFLMRIRQEAPWVFIKLDTNGYYDINLKNLLDEYLLDSVSLDIKCGSKKYKDLVGIETDEPFFSAIHLMNRHNENYKYGLLLQDYEFRTTVIGGFHTKSDFEDIVSILLKVKNDTGGNDKINRYVLQRYRSDNVLPDFGAKSSWYTPADEQMNIYAEILRPYVKTLIIR